MAVLAMTSALKTIIGWTKRFRVAQGGASAGKTVAILLYLIAYAQNNNDKLISVVSRTYPHLRTGAMRDFKNILHSQGLEPYFEASLTTSTWTYLPTGSQIEFFGADDAAKVRGPRRDVLFVNEANNLPWETFDQLATRTREFIIIDYNPTARFWAHDELLRKFSDSTDFAIFTYKDNEALSDSEKFAIESHDHNSNWWRVYGEGQIGELENNIYKGWQAVDELPDGAQLARYGVDFGSVHRTAIVAAYELPDGALFVDEKYYAPIPEISGYVPALAASVDDKTIPIVCDTARLEIIREFSANGYRAVDANKNAGSVLRGISQINGKKIFYRGKNIEREYLSYAWREKSDGTKIEEPVKLNDDAMDAIRYAVDDIVAADSRAQAIAHQWGEDNKDDIEDKHNWNGLEY